MGVGLVKVSPVQGRHFSAHVLRQYSSDNRLAAESHHKYGHPAYQVYWKKRYGARTTDRIMIITKTTKEFYLMNPLHQNIKAIRILKDYSKAFMAQALGIKQVRYARMEKGDARITAIKLSRIAETLGLSIEALASFNPDQLALSVRNATNQPVILILSPELKEEYEKRIADLEDSITTLREERHFIQVIYDRVLHGTSGT